MSYRTVFSPDAREQLRAVDKTTARRILARLTELQKDPYALDTTALVSEPGLRRLRIGDYRAIYAVHAGELVVLVVAVGHRSRVYRT